MNPSKLVRLKAEWEGFSARHPKLIRYFETLAKREVVPGTVLEVTVTEPDGTPLHANARLSEEDADFLADLQELLSKKS